MLHVACPHCRAPYEEGHVRIELTRRGRTVVLKPTDAEIWICPKCGIEDAPVPKAEPEPEADILDEPWSPPEPEVAVSLPILTASTPVSEPEPVAREIVPTMRNADVSGLTSAEYRSPRTKTPKAPKSRPKTAKCPGYIIDEAGKQHPCRHVLSEGRIAHGSPAGGPIIDRANDGPRQTRLIKQSRIGTVEPPKSYVGSRERAAGYRQDRQALQERAQALRAKQDELRALRRTQTLLAMTGKDVAASQLEAKRIMPLIRELGEMGR